MRCPRTLALSAIAVLLGCAGSPAPRAPAPLPSGVGPARPRVVVVAIYDQLGSDVLAAQLAHLDPAGAIRTTLARGRHVRRARYEHAATFTAPGHAAIHSGAPPRESGVGGNRVHLPDRGRTSALDDGEHPVWGREGAFAGPAILRAETVADVLAAERPASIVAAIGMKDRAAIVPGGRRPDLCLWFDARAGGFTSSTYYAPAPPAWLESFRARDPWAARMETPWEPRDPEVLAAWLGPDAQPGEGAYGFDATFPHDARGLEDPDAFLSLPASTDHLLALAREVVAQLAIGADEETDLLSISIAATDYVGHAFGPGSWEYADALARADLALGRFLAELEEERGPIAVVLTSDHGAAPLVERTGGVRFSSETMLPALEQHLRATLGEPPGGRWARGWVQPYVYLAPTEGPDRERALAAALAWIRAQPGIAVAVDARRIAAEPVPPGDSLDALVARGIPASPPGDVYVMPAEGSAAMEDMHQEGVGTSHGSAWLYDRDVPAIVAGPGVPQDEVTEPVRACRIAGTIAALAGVRAPEHACGAL